MMRQFSKKRLQAFTVVELLIVIVVIGILVTVSIVAYNGVQQKGRDTAVLSDIDGVAGELTRYSLANGGTFPQSLAWYSPSGTNANIGFSVTTGDVVDVVVSPTQYCVRSYNPKAKTYFSVKTAASTGSTTTACSNLDPSEVAYAGDPTQVVVNTLTWTLRTTSGSRAWKAIASSSDGTKLAAVANSDYIYTSTDSGATWTQRTSAGSRSWTNITGSSDGTKLAATSYGNIYTSTDSGATWTSRASSQYWETIAGSSDGTKLYAGTSNIYTSTDSGATWTITAAPFAGSSWYGMAVSADGTKIIAANNNDYIYTSTDSGATWTQRTSSGTSGWGRVAASSSAGKAIAYRQGGTIFKTIDAGATWVDTTTGSGYCNGTTSSGDGRKLLASNGTGVFRSINSGNSWVSSALPVSGCWGALASSDDGLKVAAVMYSGYVATGVYTP